MDIATRSLIYSPTLNCTNVRFGPFLLSVFPHNLHVGAHSPPFRTSTDQLQSLLATNGGKPVLSKAKVIGVHFQFLDPENEIPDLDRVVAVTTGSNSPDGMAVVLHIESLEQEFVVAGLKKLLEGTETIKVMIEVQRVARWLQRYGLGNVLLANCLDLQLMHQDESDTNSRRASLTQISSQFGSSTAKIRIQVDSFRAKLKPHMWTRSPLNPSLLRHLVDVVKAMVRCYQGKFGTSLAKCEAEVSPLAVKTRKFWYEVVQNCSSVGNGTKSNGTTQENPTEELPGRMSSGRDLHDAAPVNPSLIPVELVADERKVKIAFQSAIVGVHYQFATDDRNPKDSGDQAEQDQLLAITVSGAAPSDPAVVLQIASLKKARIINWVKSLLANPGAIKVMHNIHRTAYWLHSHGLQDIKLVNCFDLQLHYESTIDSSQTNADILQIAARTIPDSSEI